MSGKGENAMHEIHTSGGAVLVARMYRGVGPLTVATARGEARACSGDLILTSPGGEQTVLTPQTAHLIFGADVMAVYAEAPEFLGLAPAQIADLSSPSHGSHVPAPIALVRENQGKPSEIPQEEIDEPAVLGAGLGSGGDSGASVPGSTPAPTEETETARRVRETLERIKAQKV
jgi:hypothetical protein